MWALTNPYLHFDLFFVSLVLESKPVTMAFDGSNKEKKPPTTTLRVHKEVSSAFVLVYSQKKRLLALND